MTFILLIYLIWVIENSILPFYASSMAPFYYILMGVGDLVKEIPT